MLVKARCSDDGVWGFLEKYDMYRYQEEGYVRALCSVTMDGVLAPVFVFRGGKFVPIKDIDEEVGLERYLKAKKPFYAKIKDGHIVELKAKVNFETREYYPDKSTYEVYTLNGGMPVDLDKGLPFKKVLDVPKEFDEVVREPLRLLGESFGDREKFLRSRIYG